MPDQTEEEQKTVAATEAEAQPDPRDLRIKDLEAQVKSLTDELHEQNEAHDEEADQYEAKIKKLEATLAAKPKAAAPATETNAVYLEGQRFDVVKTVRANTTFDEVKKGFVDEGATLVVIDRVH